MANLYVCPFFTSEDPMVVRCEMASVRYVSREAMQDYRRRFCGSFRYRQCGFAMLLEDKYEEIGEGYEREEESLGEDEQVGADL